jgi:hypothetical protein
MNEVGYTYTTPPAAQPASEADMQVYRSIADNYRKDLAAAQPAVQEPVAWARYPRYTGSIQKAEIVFTKPEGKDWLELYTTPRAAQRPWVGLTDEEVMQTMSGDWTSQFYFARAIEAKLKEKNT